MFKALPLLALLAVVNCQMGNKNNLDSVTKIIFGTSLEEGTKGSLVDKKGPSTSNSDYSGKEDLSCTTEDGSIGQCVPFYLCSGKHGGEEKRSFGSVIDTSVGGRPCSSYLNVCCLPRDVQSHEKAIEPSPQPPMDDTMYATLQDIFGPPRKNSTDPLMDEKRPATPVPSINGKKDGEEYCYMQDGTIGQCVIYYLCDKNNTLVDDGADVIDVRSESLCASYQDVCCLLRNVQLPDNAIKTPQQPSMDNTMYATLQDIFGPFRRNATDPLVDGKRPSTPVPSTNSKNGGEEDLSCTMDDGTVGRCVPYYLCESNHTILDDSVAIIGGTNSTGTSSVISVGGRPCTSSLDVCCSLCDVQSHEKAIEPSPQPMMDKTMYPTLQDIFGPFRRNATDPLVGGKRPSKPVPSTNSKNGGEEDLSCTMDDGTVGRCVPYYLCESNHTILDDGVTIIGGTNSTGTSSVISEGGRPCSSSLDVCCSPRDVQSHEKAIEPSPQPMMDKTMYPTLQDIFGPFRRNATDPLVDGKRPSTPVPSTNSKNGGEEDLSCTMDDGTVGRCVPYYLCESNHTILDDGVTIIGGTNSTGTSSVISVGGRPCSSVLNVCCLPRDVQSHEKAIEPSPQPMREGCGWRRPMGVDLRTTDETAEKAKFGEFPWMVAIIRSEPVIENEPDGLKMNVYLCGGSLIAPNVVLTLAHCVADAGALSIRAGEWDIYSMLELYPFQDRDVASVELHQDFNKSNQLYDAALLFLSEPVTLVPNVGIACLPPPRPRTPVGIQCFATGWGKDKYGKDGWYQAVLKKIELTVVKQNDCQRALRSTHLGRFFQLHNSFICAGGEEGKGTCLGDEGSPLSCRIPFEEERYMQSGIVAWGIGCGEDGIPGVYVDVSIVREWIDEKMISKGLDPRIYTA